MFKKLLVCFVLLSTLLVACKDNFHEKFSKQLAEVEKIRAEINIDPENCEKMYDEIEKLDKLLEENKKKFPVGDQKGKDETYTDDVFYKYQLAVAVNKLICFDAMRYKHLYEGDLEVEDWRTLFKEKYRVANTDEKYQDVAGQVANLEYMIYETPENYEEAVAEYERFKDEGFYPSELYQIALDFSVEF